MASFTKNYNMSKPDSTDLISPKDFNDNFDILDTSLKTVDTLSNSLSTSKQNKITYGTTLPTTGTEGDIFILLSA